MSRQAALRKELEQLEQLNRTVDVLIETVRKAHGDISSTKAASDSTSALLEDWIKIISQARFTSEALRDPSWEGLNLQSDRQEQAAQEAALLAELEAIELENKRLAEKLLASPGRETKRRR